MKSHQVTGSIAFGIDECKNLCICAVITGFVVEDAIAVEVRFPLKSSSHASPYIARP